jgi:hypothetical protein
MDYFVEYFSETGMVHNEEEKQLAYPNIQNRRRYSDSHPGVLGEFPVAGHIPGPYII